MENSDLKRQWSEFEQRLQFVQSVILTTHQNPDADGLGSELALMTLLKKMGKQVNILNISPTPENLKFMDPGNFLKRYVPSQHKDLLLSNNLLIVLDVGNFYRIGQLGIDAIAAKIPMISIDHHPHNPDPVFLQEIKNTTACSVGSMIFDLFKKHHSDMMDQFIATSLYTAIVGDTGNFRFGNTTPYSHQAAAELMIYGIDAYKIYLNLFGNLTPVGAKLQARVMDNMQFSEDGKCVWFIVTRKLLKETNTGDSDTEGLTDYLRMIRGVEVSIMFKERKDGSTRINFRSKGNVATNGIAKEFGGGGHLYASGIVSELPLKEICPKILEKMQEQIRTTFL